MSELMPSTLLTEQHQQLDCALEKLMAGAGDHALLQQVIDALKLHIYVEEALMFPLVNTGRLKMPLAVMRDEHGQMWDLMSQLQDICLSGSNINQYVIELFKTIFKLFQLHNPKEEDIIYPAINEYHLTDFEPGSLIDDINDAVLPTGWVCAARRS